MSFTPISKPGQPVTCTGCDHKFKQDPPFSVDCRACGAKAGQFCKRPSGHQGPLVQFHAIRDIDALERGYYDHNGRFNKCGPNSTTQKAWEVITLFHHKNKTCPLLHEGLTEYNPKKIRHVSITRQKK